MIHSIRGLGSKAEKIQIEELTNHNIIISCSDIHDGHYMEQTVELDLDMLHSFIGTLLHVQAKLKKFQ
tara:strand:- start:2366 stop:2569 length:204 start_codon:yes stop_codon:yes gene_type:complete